MNLSDEIRKQIEENKDLKLAVGEINNHLSILEELVRKDIAKRLEEAYQKGYEDGCATSFKPVSDAEYRRGLDDAWECARKLFSTMAESDIEKAFPIEWNSGGFKALMNLQPHEAIERLKSYEDDKIKRGDIVNVKGSCNDDLLGVVTKVWGDNCYIMWGDGSGGTWCKDSVVKTGKHIDVDKFFEEIAT